MQLLTRSNVLAFSICTAALLLGGCGPGYEGEQRAEVSGSVKVDGESVEEGSLNLIPIGHDGRAASVPIENGAFLIPEKDGPNLGKYRVEIYAFKYIGPAADVTNEELDSELIERNTRQILPSEFNQESTLEIDIDSAKFQKDFDLKAK